MVVRNLMICSGKALTEGWGESARTVIIRVQEGLMKRALVGSAVAVALVAVACQQRGNLWFKGDFEAAAAVAAGRNTLVMMEFYTDWCNWCRRMENDTFSNPEVKQRLRGIVAVRVNAEQGGQELARRYGVDAYPTLVFTDPEVVRLHPHL